MSVGEKREIVITVEREVTGPDGASRRFSLSARFDRERASGAPSAEELGEATRSLVRQLEAALAHAGYPVPAARADRQLAELVETYRPRQSELVDVLEADGELTHGEAERLRTHLAAGPVKATAPTTAAAAAPSELAITDRPLAALPLANDRTPATPRPVAELITQYRIESLRQAGAVRARRQISFEEYMALKRHFAQASEGERAAPDPASRPS